MKWEIPQTDKTFYKTLFLTTLAFLLILIIYQYGWIKLENSIFQKGVNQGIVQVNQQILQSLQQAGTLTFNIPVDKNGDGTITQDEITSIILIPKQ